MRQLLVRLAAALLTFFVGSCAATVRLGSTVQLTDVPPPSRAHGLNEASAPAPSGPPGCSMWLPETSEEKAVRLAEEFVARNGYTDLPPDRAHLSHETIERESDSEEMLKQRHDSLERKAYGIYYSGRGSEEGWTVVFRTNPRYGYGKMVIGGKTVEWGRAVTMDKDFEHLRVEHKDFPLGNVHKKF